MRLHGRNAANWWEHEAAEDRYNYLYSAAELAPFAESSEVARRLVRKLYLYMNNHFEAKAVANAVIAQVIYMPAARAVLRDRPVLQPLPETA